MQGAKRQDGMLIKIPPPPSSLSSPCHHLCSLPIPTASANQHGQSSNGYIDKNPSQLLQKTQSHYSFLRRFPSPDAAHRLRCSHSVTHFRVQTSHFPSLYIRPSISLTFLLIGFLQIMGIRVMALKRSIAIFVLLSILFVDSFAYGRRVGGRTEIEDVSTNEEVQELGRFSVEEYNRRQRRSGNQSGGLELEFGEVVAAERQVVSGIKYYLKISATKHGVVRILESVVVVKPWLHSKEILSFGPLSE